MQACRREPAATALRGASGDAVQCRGAASMPKPWLTLQARALLVGLRASLLAGDDGRPELVVSRWAMTRSFRDLREAEAWLVRAGG